MKFVRRVAEGCEARRLREVLRAGGMASADGVRGGAIAMLAAAVAPFPSSHETLVLVCAEQPRARNVLDDLRTFVEPDVRLAWLPPWDQIPDFSRPLPDAVSGERLRVLQSLTSTEPPTILVAPVRSLLQPIPDRKQLEEHSFRLAVGDTLDSTELLERLVPHGFVVQPTVEFPLEIAVRGELIDLFAPNLPRPIRIERFGDEIETIRFFDSASQRSNRKIRDVEILRTSMTEKRGRIRDFLPRNSCFMFVEPADIQTSGMVDERSDAPESTVRGLFSEAADHGTLMVSDLTGDPAACHLAMRTGTVEAFIGTSFERIGGEIEQRLGTPDDIVIVSPTQAEIGRLTEILTEESPRMMAAGRIRFVHGTLSAGFRLASQNLILLSSTEMLRRTDRRMRVSATLPISDSLTSLISPELPEARDDAVKAEERPVISGHEHSGSKRRNSERTGRKSGRGEGKREKGKEKISGRGEWIPADEEKRRGVSPSMVRAIDGFSGLRPGDYVVHVAHGIALFRGLEMVEYGDQAEEVLLLEFANHFRVRVPASQIGLIQKYLGGTRLQPELSRYSDGGWSRKKKLVEEAVTDLAAQMLETAAKRNEMPGIAFPEDTPWQLEFDQAFPFVETNDQLAAMDAILRDMRSGRPMDRLLCGDVGFGKTELAVRAAFRAITAGYQVVVLAPTTVLAEQHYRTFRERMAMYPINIAMMSRFVDPGEQRRILNELESGRIDLVIGTHRVVSGDMKLQKPGLIIIDEEQRFGVRVKEELRYRYPEADILTLTATPIPRTLHQAVLGIRDISSLHTPPEARLAVKTEVLRFDERKIREAVLRELHRGGQVYFVHNRVNDMDEILRRLERIVPEAKIGVGHAQMPSGRLENVMIKFLSHQYDILLATTIVESGLDIPSANTIFIDEAHRYGLADLHQLRGRVGRSREEAYCYLLLGQSQNLTPNAMKRLRTLEEFSQLGSGFEIAMRDLEIRGAGNLLGTQQSGHIAAVGYEMYCELLERAVRRLRKQPPKKLFECEICLPWRTFIPESCVPGARDRIDLYRRMSRITKTEEYDAICAEFTDRFGRPPEEVRMMLQMVRLRLLAARFLVTRIRWESPNLRLEYLSEEVLRKLNQKCGDRIRFTDPGV
ncbi:MAG: transcription-repair coupling factor, partial [Planctomycetia bacterium]|nr:transcription-repair coupling factor [Planctomycetia bacterium]